MTFLNICQGNNCLAEVCGNIDISEKHVTVSICAEDRIIAMKLVHSIDGAVFYPERIVIPIGCISYMSESSLYDKESIRINS